ncbi:MAG: DUF928 domain-containing protein [Xenococcaceae cyanobacterium MO_167.B52]|nr:DUF928 domain-containing protein [Xenococcaceae cyanobacterium MO_167.B52]
MRFNLPRTTILLSCWLISLLAQPVLGENKQSSVNSQQQNIIFSLPTPLSRGIPLGRHKGGGSRTYCQKQQNLAVLVPINNKTVWGKTTATHPEFLFYLPQGSEIEFVLQDETDNYVYHTSRQILPERKGIISISIPQTATPLENQKTYQWTLSVSCKNNDSESFIYVQGSMEKVVLESKINTQLATANELEKVLIYAKKGIWYDAIAILARLRQDNPDDTQIKDMWSDLLEQVDLTEISSQPMLK